MKRSLITTWSVSLLSCIALTVWASWNETVESLMVWAVFVSLIITIAIISTIHALITLYMSNKQGRSNADRS